MEALEYLEKIRKYDRLIENRRLEIEDLRSCASLPAGFSSDTKVQTSRRPDRAENLIVSYLDREAELQEDVIAFWKKRQEIIRTIEQLKTAEYAVLYSTFVEGLGLQEVADQNDRSYTWAAQIKKKGLDSLQKILDERKNHGI